MMPCRRIGNRYIGMQGGSAPARTSPHCKPAIVHCNLKWIQTIARISTEPGVIARPAPFHPGLNRPLGEAVVRIGFRQLYVTIDAVKGEGIAEFAGRSP